MFCQKLLLEMKHGAFNMNLKASDKVYNGNSNIPTTQESVNVEITDEENVHNFLQHLFHKAKQQSTKLIMWK
jgi:hypothetical protein